MSITHALRASMDWVHGIFPLSQFPLSQFPLCQFPLCQFPFGQCWQSVVKWKDSALLILTAWSISYSFASILYSSRLNLLYSCHLEDCGESSHSHNSYQHTHADSQHNDVINLYPSSLFFTEAGWFIKMSKVCTRWKFRAIRYVMYYIWKWGLLFSIALTKLIIQNVSWTYCQYQDSPK